MANEFRGSFQLNLEKSAHKEAFNPGAIQLDQTGVGGHFTVVNVGTSEENMPTGDVTTEGLLVLQNLDSTNYVTWGPDSSGMVAIGRIEAGEFAFIRMEPGQTLRWQANTAACNVKMMLFED